ncbi:UNVERIFIED_ORG: hypothetical protein ABIB52_003834 [Arthrobacter sp. UYCu721]
MNIIALELRRSAFAMCMPLLFITGSVIAHLDSFPTVASWANIADVMVNVSHFLSPFVAGVAAWEALRPTRRGMNAFEETASVPSPWVRLPQLAAALIWLVACYLGILIYVVVRSLTIGLYGSPEPAALLYGLLLPALFIVVGMSISRLTRSWIAVPLSVAIAVALFGLVFFGNVPHAISSVNVFARYAAADGTTPNTAFFWSIVLVIIGTAAFTAAATVARTYRPYRRQSAFAALGAVVVLAAGAGIAIGQNGRSWSPLGGEQLQLATFTAPGKSMELKMLNHYAPVESDLMDTWSRISMLFSESDLAFSSLTQVVTNDHENAPREFGNLYLNPLSATIAEDSVQMSLYDVMECRRGGAIPPEGFGIQGSAIVETWLLGRIDWPEGAWSHDPRVQAGLSWLNGLSDDRAKTWVAEHTEEILSCSWSAEDFKPS